MRAGASSSEEPTSRRTRCGAGMSARAMESTNNVVTHPSDSFSKRTANASQSAAPDATLAYAALPDDPQSK